MNASIHLASSSSAPRRNNDRAEICRVRTEMRDRWYETKFREAFLLPTNSGDLTETMEHRTRLAHVVYTRIMAIRDYLSDLSPDRFATSSVGDTAEAEYVVSLANWFGAMIPKLEVYLQTERESMMAAITTGRSDQIGANPVERLLQSGRCTLDELVEAMTAKFVDVPRHSRHGYVRVVPGSHSPGTKLSKSPLVHSPTIEIMD